MKKNLKKIIGLILTIIISMTLWQSQASSEDEKPTSCVAAYKTGIEALEKDWNKSNQRMVDQEKPASQMVSEGFENLRTYNCWLKYTCESVLFSGIGDLYSTQGTGLTKKHIGKIPGCQAPEHLTFENEWEVFTEKLKGDDDLINALIQPDQLNVFPQCSSSGSANISDSYIPAQNRYQACLDFIETKMGDCANNTDCNKKAVNFLVLENELQAAHGDQKARALESKLFNIVGKMNTMAEKTEGLKTQLNSLNMRYACSPGKCT